MQQDKPLFSLDVDTSSHVSLTDASRWAKLVAIVGISALGFLILLVVIFGAGIAEAFADMFTSDASEIATVLIIVLVVAVAIGGLLCYFLIRGAQKTRQGLQYNDQLAFSEGLASFRNYFVMYGIITVLTALSSLLTLF